MNSHVTINTSNYASYLLDLQTQTHVRAQSDALGTLRGTRGTHMTSTPEDFALVRCILDANFSGKNFLDLGSGLGFAALYAAHHGWKSYGIEIGPKTYIASLENIATSTLPMLEKPRIAHGSFFRQSDELRRKSREQDPLGDYLIEATNYARSLDAYSTLGLSPSDIDLFYHFQIETLENLLPFFSKHAKVGAHLLLVKTFHECDLVIPHNIALGWTRDIASHPLARSMALISKVSD